MTSRRRLDKELQSLSRAYSGMTSTLQGTGYNPPAPIVDPWYIRAAATTGGFILGALALGALAGILYVLAAAARLGWELGA